VIPSRARGGGRVGPLDAAAADAVLVSGNLADNATDAECEQFRERVAPLRAPLYVLPRAKQQSPLVRQYECTSSRAIASSALAETLAPRAQPVMVQPSRFGGVAYWLPDQPITHR
jgi:hypothetical protein